MVTKARVIQTEGRIAIVETKRLSACDGCHKAEEGGCSVCSLMGGDRKIATKALNSLGAEVGDVVTIESKTTRMLLYGLLVFILPIIIALLAWGISSQITSNIAIQTVSAFCGFALALAGVALYSKKVLACRCDVEITEILEKKTKE